MKQSKWILLAEDDDSTAELTTMALQAGEPGCTVVVARDGLAVLDCLHRRGEFLTRTEGNPVLVLLDLKMPKMDGLEVLRKIKSDPHFKYIPVVMFSSSRETVDIDRSYELGANAYVVKPVDFQEFSEALKHVGQFWGATNEPPAEKTTRNSSHLAAA